MNHPDKVSAWIHCNVCFHVLMTKNRRYFILSCKQKHVLCEECMKQTKRGTMCPLCIRGIRYMELNERADPRLKELFDLKGRFQLWEKQKTIVGFQKNQFDSLLKHINTLKAQNEAVLHLLRSKEEQSKRIDEKYEKARHYRRQLQRHLKDLIEQRKMRNDSSGYKSMNNDQNKLGESFFDTESRNAVEKPTSFFTPIRGSSSYQSKVFERPIISSSQSRSSPFATNVAQFHTQKASTPTEASRNKVLTQDFSFLSTPSSAGRNRR